jgi:beta-mannosidase
VNFKHKTGVIGMLNKHIGNLAADWRIASFDFEEGLANKAYCEDYQPEDYVSASVPTTVRHALMNAGRLPDPYVGFNSEQSTWIEDKEWWFFKDFPSPERRDGQRVFLKFEGITYRAEVWVNGIQAGIIRGMFRTDEFDITDYLNESDNRLTLRIRTQENASQDVNEIGLKPGLLSGVVRAQGPVAQSMSYWNWCQHMVAVGIWQPVKLLLKSDVEIKRTRIRTLAVDLAGQDGNEAPRADAEIELAWLIENTGSKDRTVSLSYELSGETFAGRVASGALTVEAKAGQTTTASLKLNLKDALLWWPNGLGRAELHRLTSRATLDGDEELQTSEETFGIRKFTFLKNEAEDWVKKTSGHSNRPWSMIGEMYKWTFVVNGRKVFLKGSNWVILDAMLRLDHDRYKTQLSAAKNGGMNFLRIWGGSLAETREFYELCDRYGIMCWQEFWLACGNYPAMDHEIFLRCARDTVRRLLNHPSLVYYSGGNEYEPDNRENRVLVDKLAAVVAAEDPDREFRRGSPYKGDKHGGLIPTPLLTRNKYYDILYGDSRIVLFRSEVAVGRSTPVLSNFEKIVQEDKRWPLDDAWWKHFFAIPSEVKGFANEYAAGDALLPALFANWLNHARICQYNMEYCRSHMFTCSGNLNWQLNAPWPCMHREIVDVWGVPKPAYYFQKNASRPTIAILDWEKYLWNPLETLRPGIHVANDGAAVANAVLVVEIFSTDFTCLHRREFSVDIPENSSLKIGELDFPLPRELARRTLFVTTELRQGTRLLHETIYWLAVSNNPMATDSQSLSGTWCRADGSTLRLPGNDLHPDALDFENTFSKGCSYDFEKGRIVGSVESDSQSSGARYTRTFKLSDALKGKRLEFFTPGFEASDEVRLNGQVIGSHTMRSATFCHENRAFIPFDKKEADSGIDPQSEYPFSTDPIILPKLDARFYDIPEGLLNEDGENSMEISIRPAYKSAIQFDLEIRARTQDRAAIGEYLKAGVLYADMRTMPRTDLDLRLENGSLIVKNVSNALAFAVIIEFSSDKTGDLMPLDDNALTIRPQQEKRLKQLSGEALPETGTIRLYGWNVDEKTLNLRNPLIATDPHAT